MDIERIQVMMTVGEKVPTGKKDINGDDIFLGDKLENITCSCLTYEVRIRQGKFVLHTGGSYIELNDINAKKCKLNQNVKLGMGQELFSTQLIG